MREARNDVDAPAELLGAAAAPCGPTGSAAGSRRGSRASRRSAVVQQRGAASGRRPRSAGAACAARASAGRAGASRTAPSAPPRRRSRRSARAGGPPRRRGRRAALAHRARRVGAEALALARDHRRHEVERVQLGVRVRQRGAGLAPLVDDQLDVGAVGVRAHPLAPDLDRRRRPARPVSSASDETGCGRVDDHLVRARRGGRREQVGRWRCAAARRRRASAPGTGWERRAPSSRACPAPPPWAERVDLRRRASSWPSANGSVCGSIGSARRRPTSRRRGASARSARRSCAGR